MKRLILDKLNAWKVKKGRKPLILEGARQVGKTYALEFFGRESFCQYHYINFEDQKKLCKIFDENLTAKRIIDDLELNLDINIDPNNDLLIFDEIQECPNALTSLKYFCEQMPELAIASAGSLLGIKLGSSSYPVGKVDLLQMHPMNFLEFLHGIGKEKFYNLLLNFSSQKDEISSSSHSSLWELLKLYFVTGGLPEVVQTFRDNQEDLSKALRLVREKQDMLVRNYQADIAKHSGKENSMHIEALWKSAALQLGQEQDENAPKFKFKDAVPNIKEYSRLEGVIHWLMKTGLLLKSPIVTHVELPLAMHEEANKFKLFIFDIGILGALAKLHPKTILDYDYGTYKGFFAENFMAQEMVCSLLKHDELFSWKGRTSEIEFVIDYQGQVLPLEVKSGKNTRSKSLKVFSEKYHPNFKMIVSAREYTLKGNLCYYPLYCASNLTKFLSEMPISY